LIGCCLAVCWLPFQALTRLNKFLAKDIAQKVDGVVAGVRKTNPQLADFLKTAMDRSAEKLRGLPGIMGYQQGDGE
jgi:hypothetical protein